MGSLKTSVMTGSEVVVKGEVAGRLIVKGIDDLKSKLN